MQTHCRRSVLRRTAIDADTTVITSYTHPPCPAYGAYAVTVASPAAVTVHRYTGRRAALAHHAVAIDSATIHSSV